MRKSIDPPNGTEADRFDGSLHAGHAAPSIDATCDDGYFQIAAASLATRPQSLGSEMCAALLSRHYGLTGTILVLSSEVEQTAQVSPPDGEELIFKTSTRSDAIDSFRFQTAALTGLEGASGFTVPRVLSTSDKNRMFESGGVCGYLQTRLAGQPLHQARPTPELLFDVGHALAELNLALGLLEVPAIHRPVLWHIRCWPRLLEFAPHLPAGPVAELVGRAMRTYAEAIAPQLGALAWQVTHNDPSPFNTLLTTSGIGFIDFGDGGWGPRVQDLAIAASHMVSDASAPLGGAEYLIAGYASVLPLSALEMRLLVGLMRARQSALILVNYWRAELFPADAAYIKKNVARAENGLSILARLDEVEAESAVVAAVARV